MASSLDFCASSTQALCTYELDKDDKGWLEGSNGTKTGGSAKNKFTEVQTLPVPCLFLLPSRRSHCFFTAFAVKTLPLPCVFRCLRGEDSALPCGPHFSCGALLLNPTVHG